VDLLGRRLRDLRISVTDRCNFRCRYCMPKEIFNRQYTYLSRDELLSFEEIDRVAAITVSAGVDKIRLTGGEPLLRSQVERLIEKLAKYGVDLTMTTNGALLAQKAETLAAAGLNRVTVSLDSLDDEVFMAMNDVGFPVEKVLAGIEAAAAAGLGPVKVNAVVKRGVNDHTVGDLARYGRERGHIVRFIEYMDVGRSNGWRLDEVVPAAEILERLAGEFPFEPVAPNYPGEVARRFRYSDGKGEFGVIGSVTQPFCGSCTRLRLSADGQVFTCLFATEGDDVRSLLRAGASDDELARFLADTWSRRDDRYSEMRSSNTVDLPKVEMSYIGG
jgi:cyclic pyranopterin phosphate synthase